MKTFKDNEGREWMVDINVSVLKNIRDVLNIDLMEAVDGQLVTKIADDPALLCDILFLIVAEQTEKRAVTDEAFGRSLAGDAIDHATTAFLEELVDFFPKLRRRPLKTVMEKVKKHESAVMDYMETTVSEINVDEAIQKALKSGPSFMNSPDKSALTPDPSK